MRHYEMTVKRDRDFTEQDAESVMDSLGDDFDSADVRGSVMTIDGAVSSAHGIVSLMAAIRGALGWDHMTRMPNTIEARWV